MNARLSAHAVLSRVERDGAYSNIALMNELEKEIEASDADKRLTTELVYGSLRHQRLLDHWITYLADRPVAKIDPAVLHVLRLSLYQLLLLDRIPQHAVLSESGKLLRKIGRKHAVGFVNALLRRTLRELKEEKGPAFPEDPLKRISIEQSIPLWLIKRWAEELKNSDASDQKYLRKLSEKAELANRVAPLTVLPNRRKLDRNGLIDKIEQIDASCIKGEYAKQAVTITRGGVAAVAPLVEQGLCIVMDEAAQLVGELLQPESGERILDLCAAPGGKTLYAAGFCGERGQIVSLDISSKKLLLLQKQAEAHGFNWIKTEEADSTGFIEKFRNEPFDKVMLDAPCTALGIIRRHPEIRWQRKESDIYEMAKQARKIIDNAVQYVKPGGSIVFSVCTNTKEEGLEQLEYLSEIKGLNNVQVESIESSLWKEHNNCHYIDTSTIPTLDGFFMCRFEKEK